MNVHLHNMNDEFPAQMLSIITEDVNGVKHVWDPRETDETFFAFFKRINNIKENL